MLPPTINPSPTPALTPSAAVSSDNRLTTRQRAGQLLVFFSTNCRQCPVLSVLHFFVDRSLHNSLMPASDSPSKMRSRLCSYVTAHALPSSKMRELCHHHNLAERLLARHGMIGTPHFKKLCTNPMSTSNPTIVRKCNFRPTRPNCPNFSALWLNPSPPPLWVRSHRYLA